MPQDDRVALALGDDQIHARVAVGEPVQPVGLQLDALRALTNRALGVPFWQGWPSGPIQAL
jgi:hypothetical protein